MLVNTSCVDGSIVFIDPISFSVLKKVTLRFQDYEIPKEIKDSVTYLRKLFDKVYKEKNKDMSAIFLELLDRDTEEVKVKDFVEHMVNLLQEDLNLKEKLY